MARYFTLYLPSDICEWHYANNDSGLPFSSAPGSMISHSEIAPGDMVYGINVVVGTLFVIGRMQVDRTLTSYADAVKLLGTAAWETPEYLIAAEGTGTPMYFSRQLPWDLAMQLRLVGSTGTELPLALIDDGEIDSKQLREVRELTPASATLLDEFLAESFEELLESDDFDDDGETVEEEVVYGFGDDGDEDFDDFDEDADDLTDEELAAIAMDFESGEQFAAVAEAAIGIVTDYFHNEGFRVSMADDDSFYDLRCNKDDEEYHVIVYGTPQEELRFLMTDEDLAAATEDDDALVCVVTNADTEEAELSIFDPDALLDDFLYRPLQWGFWYAGDDEEFEEQEEEEDGEEVKE